MSQKAKKGVLKSRKIWIIAGLVVLVLLGLGFVGLLHSSPGAMNNAASGAPIMGIHAAQQKAASSDTGVAANSNGSTSQPGQSTNSAQYGPQYLQKSLQVSMEVQDPNRAANDLQQWLAGADPQATSDGSDYENMGGTQYNVTLTYLVDVDHYTQVEDYLRTYAGQKGNTLLSLHESVQDVTNDYVDSQSTLTNLRAEQQRLLGFMNQAQNVTDAANIEQQLAQVEGQINSIEAHLNALKGQTTFYTITINLQPVGSIAPPAQPSSWNAIPVWQGAWTAVVSVWQLLATLLIWLAAFSIYIVPALLIIWLARKRLRRRNILPHVAPAISVPVPALEPDDAKSSVD